MTCPPPAGEGEGIGPRQEDALHQGTSLSHEDALPPKGNVY